MKEILKRTITTYFIVIFICFGILMFFDTKHFGGVKKENDTKLIDRVINRCYYITTIFSTVGFGDIQPASRELKCFTILMHLLVIIGIVDIIITHLE